jgi:hypothetical protein
MNSSTKLSSRTDRALLMAGRNWNVFPCTQVTNTGYCSCRQKEKCGSPGKHPRIKNWQDHATTDPDQIKVWWKKWGDANIGIATGAESNLVVLDFDPRHGGLQTLKDLVDQYPEIKNTFRVATGGGGWHLYFTHPAESTKTCSDILPGMDIRGTGGLVIGPGSIHESGKPYQIENADDPIPLPAGLLPLCLKQTYARTYEGTEEQRKNNLGSTEEQLKQIGEGSTGSKKNPALRDLDFNSLTDEQKTGISKAVERSIPDAPARRNRLTLTLARWLLAVPGIDKTIDPESLRPIVKRWHDMALTSAEKHRFTIKSSFNQTMDDFRYSFANAKCPMNTTMSGVVANISDEIREHNIPDTVKSCGESLGYTDDRDVMTLISLCWHLHQLWEIEGFPLASRSAATALEVIGTSEPRSFQWVSRTMTHLERDKVIRCLHRVPKGTRGKANTYLWTWTPPAAAPPELDWLTSGTSRHQDKSAAQQLRDIEAKFGKSK